MAEQFDIGGGFSEQVGDVYRNNAGKFHAVAATIGLAGQAAWNSLRGASESLPAATDIPIDSTLPAACSDSVLPSVASTISSTLTGGIVGGLATGAKLLSDSKTRSQMQTGMDDLGKNGQKCYGHKKTNLKRNLLRNCRKQQTQ